MAERYQRQIGENGPPSVYLHNYVTPDSTGAGVASALGGLGGAMDQMGLAIQAYNDKQDEIDLMAATNDYNRRMNSYLNDPEAGQLNTRKLKDARGLLKDTETHADELVKDITSRLGEKAGDRFKLVEQRLRQPYASRSATYEAGQRAEYGKITVDSKIQGNLQSVQADPLNEELLATMKEDAWAAAFTRLGGMTEEQQENVRRGLYSKFDTARIEQVAASNPLLANQMIQNSADLLPGDAVALTAKVKPEVERVEVQGIVDGLLQQFGPGNAAEVSKYVRENYEGAREDAIMSRYKVVSNELTAGEGAARAANGRAQQEYYESAYYQRYQMQGLPVPMDQVDQDYRAGNISMTHREALARWNTGMATRSNLEKMLSNKNPNAWTAMPSEQQEQAIMQAAGRTQEERDRALGYLRQAVTDPESGITSKDIDEYYLSMFITGGEAENYKSILRARTTEDKDLASTQTKRLNADLDAIFTESAFFDSATRKAYAGQAKSLFLDSVAQAQEMGLKGPELFEYLRKARQQALVTVIADLNQNAYGFLSDPRAFDSQVTQMLEKIGSETNQSSAPAFRVDKIDLATPIATIPRNNSYCMAMVPQGTNVSSDYYAQRDGGKRQHMAIDIAAPEGSPIYSADFGANLAVSSATSSETAGNTVELTGARQDGKTVKVRLIHLQNLHGIKAGATINPGDYIAQVGNTGSTSRGAHMHIEIYVNDKRVDPEKYLAEAAEVRRQQQVQSAGTVDTTQPEEKEKTPEPATPPVSADVAPADDESAVGTLMDDLEAKSADVAPPPVGVDAPPSIDAIGDELLGGVL